MRHKKLWAASLTLCVSLCGMGIAMGQDPTSGNWFSRLFSRGAPATAHKEEKAVAMPAVSSATARAQADADFLRRLSVCDELRRIAMENDDVELARRADLLQVRAKDAYIQRINRSGGGLASVDEDTLASHLAPKGGSLTPLTSGTKTKAATGQASAEGR